MRSAALAIGWEFRRRHLWTLVAMAVYMLVLAAIKILILGPGSPIRLDPPDGRAALVIVPLSATFFYYLGVFSFGFAGDLGARQSIYPARMFVLPVKTSALVDWPMLYGTGTVALLWFTAAFQARWPWGVEVPLVWPAVMAAVFLAWTQALTWMSYGLPGMRVVVTVLLLAGIDAAVLVALHFKVGEPVMLAILAPQIPLAYFVARVAVARARRGDVPDWRPVLSRFFRAADSTPRSRPRFESPDRAQAWFEWRQHGRALPGLVALLLPFELALLWVAGDAPELVLEILLVVLLTPPLMAWFVAASVRKANPHARDAHGVSPFIATRPLTSAALIAAKLRMAMWSTGAAWLCVLVAIPLALTWSGIWPMVHQRAIRAIDLVGMPRAVVAALLVVAGLMASTWKQLVQGLYVGLTGRDWIIRSNMFLALALLVAVGPIAQLVHDDSDVQAVLWSALPEIFAVLVLLKMGAAGWVAARLAGSGLVSDRTLLVGAASWVAAVFGLYGVLGWLVSGPLIPRYFLALIAIVAIPLVRLSAAPLALAWNRHR